jgi:acetolactate decarboxylase
MRRFLIVFLIVLAGFAGGAQADSDVLTQVSTIDALMTGIYDGETTLAALLRQGDFGIGTFNSLDGEMVLLEGQVYRVTGTGSVERPPLGTKVPFAAVTFFKADRKIPLAAGLTMAQFISETDRLLPTPNVFYAIRISGTFENVKTRSVPRQEKPYRPLTEVVKTQPEFDLKNVRGTMVGFRCPSYVKGVNVPGYHLHFITADAKAGGHVLDFKVQKAITEIDDTNQFFLMLPSDSSFYKADLAVDREKELSAAERGKGAQ